MDFTKNFFNIAFTTSYANGVFEPPWDFLNSNRAGDRRKTAR